MLPHSLRRQKAETADRDHQAAAPFTASPNPSVHKREPEQRKLASSNTIDLAKAAPASCKARAPPQSVDRIIQGENRRLIDQSCLAGVNREGRRGIAEDAFAK